jgi:hypothetical protein
MIIKRWTLVTVAVVVATMLILMLSARAGGQSNPAQAKPSVMQKWEYCAVTDVNRRPPSVPGVDGPMVATVVYFLDTGEKRETLEVPSGKSYDSLAKAFTKLGQDGWELVFEGAETLVGASHTNAFYFKRPKG